MTEEQIKKEYYEAKGLIRMLVRTRADMQSIRVANSNRLGIKADGKAQNAEKLTPRNIAGKDKPILEEISRQITAQEDEIEKRLKKALKRMPIYTDYLAGISGIGAIGSGYICGEIDIFKVGKITSLWQYAGLNSDGVWGKKRVEQKDGKVVIVTTDEKIRGDRPTKEFLLPYNARLRTGLRTSVIDPILKKNIRWLPCTDEEWAALPENFRRIGDGSKNKDPDGKYRLVLHDEYSKLYYDYKWRKQHSDALVGERQKQGLKTVLVHIPWKEARACHIDDAARRYAMKMFLDKLWRVWRPMYGLSTRPTYQEERLGHVHNAGKAA